MKLLVAVKRVVDYNVRIRVKSDGSDVELANVKMGMNPFCEIAVEEGVRLREAGVASELVVVTFGPEAAAEQLRHALALGADRALHYVTDETLTPLTVARALQKVCEREQPSLVLLGKQSIDSDNNQVGQMLSALCDWPLATFASAIKLVEGELQVTREIDGGLETLGMGLPAVVTVDLRLNEPRYVTLPNIMKAKKKQLDTVKPEDLGVDVAPRLKTLKVTEPAKRGAGIKVADVAALVEKLKNEAKVI